MLLYLIRHCESENNALWARTGSNEGRADDPLLTPRGMVQADVLAAYLDLARHPSPAPHAAGPLRDGLLITHLYTSLMQRAIQTAVPIARTLSLPLVALDAIHERGGIYVDDPHSGERHGRPGLGRTYFETNYPEVQLPTWLDDSGWWNRPYEERDAAYDRAGNVLQSLVERHGRGDDHVALVTHGGFIQSLLQVMFGISPNGSAFSGERYVWFKENNASITRVDITRDMLRLSYLNYIDYMPGDLLT